MSSHIKTYLFACGKNHLLNNIKKKSKVVNLFDSDIINRSSSDLNELKAVYQLYIVDLLGLKTENQVSGTNEAYKKAIDLLLNMRMEAKQNKDWATSDKIRNELTAFGFEIKDSKDGFEWKI